MDAAPVIEIPEGATLVFKGLEPGDEDFFSEQCGHLNVSLAYREIKRAGFLAIPCHVPRADLPAYRSSRDVDAEHVARLKAGEPQALDLPVLLGELEPSVLTLIDGIHRLMAKAELYPDADPIRLMAYVVPHHYLDLMRIEVYYEFDDGRREPIDQAKYMATIWGKYTQPGYSKRG